MSVVAAAAAISAGIWATHPENAAVATP